MADISVTGAVAVREVSSQPGIADQGAPKVGAGSIASAGVVPDTVGLSHATIIQSLSKFFSRTSGDQVDAKMARASLTLKEVLSDSQTSELVTQEEKKRQNAGEARQQAEESQQKLDEANRARKKSGFFSSFSSAFSLISGIATMVLGAALIASGVGAPAGALLLVAGGAMTFASVDSMVAQETGAGVFGHVAGAIMEWAGASEERIEEVQKKVDLSVQIIAAIVAITASIATLRFDTAAASAANIGKQIAAVQQLAPVIIGATALGTAASQTASATYNFHAAQHQSNAMKLQADSADLQSLNQLLDDFIDQILARISGTNTQFNAMLDDIVASVKDRGDTLARAKFAG